MLLTDLLLCRHHTKMMMMVSACIDALAIAGCALAIAASNASTAQPAASNAAASDAPAIAPSASNLALPRARSYSDDVMSISSSNSSSDEAAAANAARMGVEAAIHMAKASAQIHQLRSTCLKPGGSKLVIMLFGPPREEAPVCEKRPCRRSSLL